MANELSIPAFAKIGALGAAVSVLSQAASGGVGGNAPFPHISIKQSRWRLIDIEGTEEIVKSFSIHFVVVSINPTVSKTYYADKYKPGDEPSAPPCSSDDGVAPALDSAKPQSRACASCQWNVWGSEISDAGKKLKKCKDNKRIGVVLAEQLAPSAIAEFGEPDLYGWRLPAMTMINFSNFAKETAAAGGALDFVIVKAEFDDKAEYPVVRFSVERNMTEAEYNVVVKMRASPRAGEVAGVSAKVINIVERMEPVEPARTAAVFNEAELEDPAVEVAKKAAAEAAKKKAALRAALAALDAEGDVEGAAPAPAPAPAANDVTDVVAKPRQRSPVNVQKPTESPAGLDDLLSRALAG